MKQARSLRKPGIEIRKVLATNIRAARLGLGISQEEFADSCGLHRTYIGAIERAERNVTLSTLEVISRALGIPAAELLSPKQDQQT